MRSSTTCSDLAAVCDCHPRASAAAGAPACDPSAAAILESITLTTVLCATPILAATAPTAMPDSCSSHTLSVSDRRSLAAPPWAGLARLALANADVASACKGLVCAETVALAAATAAPSPTGAPTGASAGTPTGAPAALQAET
eukprot:scaffold3493_cov84-Isochrysis_galbana.AAC.3